MGDPYYRYGASADIGSDARQGFPGYLSSDGGYLLSETPSLASTHALGSTDLRGISSDFLKRDITPLISGAYGSDDIGSIGVHPESVYGGVSAGASIRGYSAPLEDPNLLGQRRDVAPGISSGIPDVITGRPSSLRNVDGHSIPLGESNILHVDGLPTDCTRREVGHLFRPFIGYKDIKVVHKEARHSGDRARVLCFVEFADPKCALTALEALQGYKFDDKNPDSSALRIQFVNFPFRPPSDSDGQKMGIPR